MDLLVEAYVGVAAGVSVQHIGKDFISAILGSFDSSNGVVAPVRHLDGDVGIDRPANGEVEDVSSDKPRKHENAKSDIASSLHAHVLEQLGNLHGS